MLLPSNQPLGTLFDHPFDPAVDTDKLNQILLALYAGLKQVSTPTPGVMQLWQRYKLTGTTPSVTFSGIPQNGTDLLLTCLARGDQANANGNTFLQFNGDTGANYDSYQIFWNGSPASNGASDVYGQTFHNAAFLNGSLAPAGVASHTSIRAYSYANTTFQKAVRGETDLKDANAASNQYFANHIGFWRSTAGITSIKLFPNSGNYVAGSEFSLYIVY